MHRFVGIDEAAKVLGESISMPRRWDAAGKPIPGQTLGSRRRYDLAQLRPGEFRAASDSHRQTIAYARVSSHDQKDDLERQKQALERYWARQGWTFEVVTDLGSGMNYRKKSLRRLLAQVIDESVGRLVITHKNRKLLDGIHNAVETSQAC